MKYEAKNTLAYYDSAPQTKLIDLSGVPVPQSAINCQQFLNNVNFVKPEREAVEFYLLNHLVMIVRRKFTKHQQLPEWAAYVMDCYERCLIKQGRRMLTYLMLITTREARHASIGSELNKELTKTYGPNLLKFWQTIKGNGSDGAAQKFMSAPPEMAMGPYFNALAYIFFKAVFSSNYGGKPWGNIATTLAQFLDGKTSMEMMLDTAYTLAHNGGPIFNKGMCYDTYTNDWLYKILDVQRAGQIPELAVTEFGENYMTQELKRALKYVKDVAPEEFKPEVDWYRVEELGSKQKYPKEKAKMVVKPQHAIDKENLEKEIAKKANEAYELENAKAVAVQKKAMTEWEAAQQAKKTPKQYLGQKVTGTLQITPETKVLIVERAK